MAARKPPSRNRLTILREAQGLSDQQLAALLPSSYGDRVGPVDVRSVRAWEQGAQIPEEHWTRLAEIFGVSIAYLLGVEGNGSNGGNGLRAVA